MCYLPQHKPCPHRLANCTKDHKAHFHLGCPGKYRSLVVILNTIFLYQFYSSTLALSNVPAAFWGVNPTIDSYSFKFVHKRQRRSTAEFP